MIPVIAPLLDSKTIRIAQSADPIPSNLGTEIVVALGLLALFLAALFLLPRLWRPVRTEARAVEEDWVLIDGSNVMHWRDNVPSLDTVRAVVDRLRDLGYVPGVVFDANAGWKLVGRYLHDQDFARLLGLETRQVLVVAKGTQADPFLLQTAREFGARIVTNDGFRDWAADHPEVQQSGFLIRGSAGGNGITLRGLEPVKPK